MLIFSFFLSGSFFAILCLDGHKIPKHLLKPLFYSVWLFRNLFCAFSNFFQTRLFHHCSKKTFSEKWPITGCKPQNTQQELLHKKIQNLTFEMANIGPEHYNKYIYIYIYGCGSRAFAYLFWVSTHLPPAFGPKKGPFFVHKFVRKKDRVLTLHIKKRLWPPFPSDFSEGRPETPCFIVFWLKI